MTKIDGRTKKPPLPGNWTNPCNVYRPITST